MGAGAVEHPRECRGLKKQRSHHRVTAERKGSLGSLSGRQPLTIDKLLLGIWDGRGEQLLRVLQRGRGGGKGRQRTYENLLGAYSLSRSHPR